MVDCIVCQKESRFLYRKNNYDIYRCPSCFLGFIHPLPSYEELDAYYNSQDYYNSHEIGYTNYGMIEPMMRAIYRDFIRDLKRYFQFELEGKTILDVGCAYGYFSDAVSEYPLADLLCTDMTDESRKVIEKKDYPFILGNFETLDFGSRTFDLVFMGDVFEHFLYPHNLLQKLKNLLNPGGVAMFNTIDFASWFARFNGASWRLMIPPEHTYYWTKKSVNLIFEQYGFEGFCKSYKLMIPKQYLIDRIKQKHSFNAFFLNWYPFTYVPIRSFDTIECLYRKMD